MAKTPEEKQRRDAIKEAKRARDEAEKAYRQRVRAARDNAARAERERERALSDTRRALREAEKRYEKSVAQAEKELENARIGPLLGGYGRFAGNKLVRLYDNRLETPNGTVPLSKQVKAKVESSGRKTEKRDTRELYLLIDTPAFDSAITCNPNDNASLRQLAASINTAAKNAAALIEGHDAREAAAEARLAQVRGDRAEIDEASARLAATEADTDALEAARAALAEAEADTAEIDARSSALLALDPTARLRAPSAPRRSLRATARPSTGRTGDWWRDRSRKGKVALVVGALLAFFVAIGALSDPPAEETTVNEAALVEEDATEPTTEATTTAETTTSEAEPAPPPPAVARVVDGDTIRLDDGTRVRLVQIDAPELAEGECYARQSARALRRLLPRGTPVRLEADGRLDSRDRFGRQLRYVWKGSRNVNLLLVQRGIASVWFFQGDRGRYARRLLGAAREAKRARRGLWRACAATKLTPLTALATARPAPPPPEEEPPEEAAPAANCHPSYSGACLDPNASDYDCAGGSGNGPEYTGFVTVVGYDEYGLDSDGDGAACED